MMKNCKETLLDKGRKLFSLLLCALTVSACNDDDCINSGTDNNNLQVEVSASLHSRAPILDSTLPDNNPIGVTLTATDGGSYDNQNYNNIPYYGITADGKQTWQPQDKPVTLSVTEGVAMAYWPYNKDAVDMTAVPVETDSQTDYMYSGNVTGLTNAAPKAAFQMKHAMALVRVNVVRGTYTAAGTVTAVTAASEAFCTSGTMNVSTGALADLAGAETPFIEEPADAVITTAGRITEFLVLPDVDVDAASVTLAVTVDGRKYSTAVEVTEAFKQGYIYTYNLTLDNTALNVSGVSVTPWEKGSQYSGSLDVVLDNKYIVEIEIEDPNIVYAHNVAGFTGTIDWGDGTTSTYDEFIGWPSHTYSTAGKYTVMATGMCMALMQAQYENGIPVYKDYIFSRAGGFVIPSSPFITKIIHIGGEMGISSLKGAFYGQTKLKELKRGIFDGLSTIDNISYVFSGCTGLTSIPQGLFDECTEVEDFEGVFEGCEGLTNIPDGLFDYCTKVSLFRHAFFNCTNLTSIPDGLFDKCTEVDSFNGTFSGCASLTSIPEGLFDNCTAVTNFAQTFANCVALTSIPAGLFDKCTDIKYFTYTFEGCTELTGESPYTIINVDGTDVKVHLYERSSYPEHFTAPTGYKQCFNGCAGLTDYVNIPAAWK